MKVKELIEKLSKCDQEADVVLSSDSEGNSYQFLETVCNDYNCEGDYYVEIGLKELTVELERAGYSEEDTMPEGNPCVVLWP